jgi:hypothetical protein
VIKNFENETQPLTEWEKVNILPMMITGLLTKRGKEMIITNTEMCKGINKVLKGNGVTNYTLNGPRVRKFINHIRCNRLITGYTNEKKEFVPAFICAGSNGYWLESTYTLVADYIQGVQGRIDAMVGIVETGKLALEDIKQLVRAKERSLQRTQEIDFKHAGEKNVVVFECKGASGGEIGKERANFEA